jgi:hypothetical protein
VKHHVAAAALVVAGSTACSDALITYPLEGRLYDEMNDCLDPEGVLDVIEGEAVGTCEGVRCFQSKESGDYLVTAQCEPPPGYDDRTDEVGGTCEKALAAYARGGEGTCLPQEEK